MRRSISRIGPMVVAAGLVVSAAACGDDDGDDAASTTSVAAQTTEQSATSTTSTGGGGGGDTTSTSPGTADGTATTAPATGERLRGCARLEESPDGVYQLGDAGEVEIAVDGDTVRLVEARPAEGWTATGDTEDDDDEVEVDFRLDGRHVEFEAEIDDGRLEVDLCDR